MTPYDELSERLQNSGFELLGLLEQRFAPTPNEAASIIAGASPSLIISTHECDESAGFDRLARAWLAAAEADGVLAPDELLISVGNLGSLPWARVRLRSALVIDKLGPRPGEPEFVAMDIAGSRLCGITTEEKGFWLVQAAAKQSD